MRDIETNWKRGAVLVCAHERPPGADKPSCGAARGGAIKDQLKDKIRAAGLKDQIIALKTSCQSVCSALGVTATVLTPDGKCSVLVESDADVDALLALAKGA